MHAVCLHVVFAIGLLAIVPCQSLTPNPDTRGHGVGVDTESCLSDQISLVIATVGHPDRVSNINRILVAVKNIPLVNKTLIIWNSNPEESQEYHRLINDPAAGVHVMVFPNTSMNHRWSSRVVQVLHTCAAIVLDDDAYLWDPWIFVKQLWMYWRSAHKISGSLGVMGFNIRRNSLYNTGSLKSNTPGYKIAYDLNAPHARPHYILPPFVVHRTAISRYNDDALKASRSYVDENDEHCDDLMLNLVAHSTGRTNVVCPCPEGYGLNDTLAQSGISGSRNMTDRFTARTKCMIFLEQSIPKSYGASVPPYPRKVTMNMMKDTFYTPEWSSDIPCRKKLREGYNIRFKIPKLYHQGVELYDLNPAIVVDSATDQMLVTLRLTSYSWSNTFKRMSWWSQLVAGWTDLNTIDRAVSNFSSSLDLDRITKLDIGRDSNRPCSGGEGEVTIGPMDPRLLLHPRHKVLLLFDSRAPYLSRNNECMWTCGWEQQHKTHLHYSFAHRKVSFLKSQLLKPPKLVNSTCERSWDNSQKNWMPFWFQGMLLMSQSIRPHIVVKVSLSPEAPTRIFSQSRSARAWHNHTYTMTDKRISGGTPWVRLKTHSGQEILVAIVHQQHGFRQYANYVIAAKATPPFDIVAMSTKPLPLQCNPRIIKKTKGSSICFATGLSIHKTIVYVSYGAGDAESWLWMIDSKTFLNYWLAAKE